MTPTGNTGVAGSVALTPPDISLAGSLVNLSGSLVLPGAALVNQCGKDLGATDLSSFIVTGNGGVAPDPGEWQPDTADASGWIWYLTPRRDRAN